MAKIGRQRIGGAGLVVLGVVAATAAGCLQPSLTPLIRPQDSVFDERLLGVWTCGGETWTFVRHTDTDMGPRELYRVEVRSGDRRGDLGAWLGRLGNDLFITFVLLEELDLPTAFLGAHVISTFTFGRVTIEPNRLRFAMLESEWIDKAEKAGLLAIGVRTRWTEPDEGSVLLTASPTDLQRFARAWARDDEVFGEKIELVRPSADATADATAASGQCYSPK